MIYIHIPYCKQKCSYCNFHFSTSLQSKDDFLLALHKEIEFRKHELPNNNLQTLYFGGGSPSILSIGELNRIIEKIQKYFHFNNDIEITLEANPDDLNNKYVKELAQTPINRLSIGVQSFHDEDLQLMNRAHNAAQADSCIKRVQDAGLENISIDLIYGNPSANSEIWKNNLQKTINLQIPHISSYALTVEPKTALNQWVKTGKIKSPNENQQNEDFFWMSNFLKENGFEHYEISNFALPNYYSKHNTAYWQNQAYLGLGPSAHSFDGNRKRSWNVSNNIQYVRKIMSGSLPQENEILSENERFNETVMIGLRTKWGVNLSELKNNYSTEILDKLQQNIQQKLETGILEIKNNVLIIPENHWFAADGIAADLFII